MSDEQALPEQQYDPLLEEDLAFLKDIRVHVVNGKRMMGTEQRAFNVEKVYTEEEFVKHWLMQFTLGNKYGVNYFNSAAWGRETNMGTLCVMVVDNEDKPLFIIPPITSTDLSPRDFDLLRAASLAISNNRSPFNGVNDPNQSLRVAREVQKHLGGKRISFTDMVPEWFYERHSIDPDIEQKVFYIKDVINQGVVDLELLNQARVILYKEKKGEKVTKDEYQLLTDVSRGQFIVPGEEDKETANEKEQAAPSSNSNSNWSEC